MVKVKYFWQGYRAALPLLVGVIPFGIVFGAVAVNVGLTFLEAVGMSFFVFAGSSQFVAVQFIDSGASLLLILAATFLINFRNVLYSASLASAFRPLATPWKWLLAHFVVDESYALIIARIRQGDLSSGALGWFMAGICTNLLTIWLGSTGLGAFLNDTLPSNLTQMLGFTLPLIFTGLIVPLLVTRPALLAAISAALAGILLAPLPHNIGLLLAAFIGVAVGLGSEKSWIKQPLEVSAV